MAKTAAEKLHAEIQKMMEQKGTAATIRQLTRRANRRIERAVGGQRTYLESIVRGGKFSASVSGMTETQKRAAINRLERFLGAWSTTRVGWDVVKMDIVHKTQKTLAAQENDKVAGYTITDEELAEILMQVNDKDKTEFYRVVNLVEAARNKEGWQGTADEIASLIKQKISDQDALEMAMAVRKENKLKKMQK